MASIRPRARSPGRHAWQSHHNQSQGCPSSPPSPRPSEASSLASALARALCLSSRKPSRRRPPLARLVLIFLALGFILGFCELGLRSRYGYLPEGRDIVSDLPSSSSISQIPPPDHDPKAFRRAGVELEAVPHEDGVVAVELEARKEEDEDDIRRMPPPEQSDMDGDTVTFPLSDDSHRSLPLLIVVTPTYNRALQAYFLTRLAQTLRLVAPPLLWIVVESGAASPETAELLRGTGVMYRHLVSRQNSTSAKDRGVHQRNAALEHIERHQMDGVVYFADDDNIYSFQLFQQLREIRRFGTWPVAMLAQSKNKATLEGPVCNGNQVIGWHTNEKSKRFRRFHVDMSGFAFNSTILWDLKRWRHLSLNPIRQLDTVKEGFQETTFIEQVVEDESQMEAVPSGCAVIMNWHLHLDAHRLVYPRGWRLQKNLEVVVPLI